MRRTLAFALACALLAPTAAIAADDPMRPPVTPIRASKIVLVGDSTTAVQGGWGGTFCDRHVASFLACTNLARGGRSTYNYRAEGSWDIALHEMRAGKGDAHEQIHHHPRIHRTTWELPHRCPTPARPDHCLTSELRASSPLDTPTRMTAALPVVHPCDSTDNRQISWPMSLIAAQTSDSLCYKRPTR